MDKETKENVEGFTAIGFAVDSVGNTLNYAQFVNTLVKPLNYTEDFNHMAIGAAGEVGELLDAIKRHTIYEKPLDVENVKEEIGDLFFYIQRIMFITGLSLNTILDHNVKKLEKRYHEKKFYTQQAQARADKNDQA